MKSIEWLFARCLHLGRAGCGDDWRMGLRHVILTAGLLAGAGVARAYPVTAALSLEKLAAEADIIFKGKAISSGPVRDGWFKPYPDFVVRETQFAVISVMKGEAPGPALQFRHYDLSPQPQSRMFQPQFYHFDADRAYIVFATRSETGGVFRQTRANHTSKGDQGALLCPGDQPVKAQTVKEAFWDELTLMLKNADARCVVYAIRQLDQMSGGRDQFDGTQDFDRPKVQMAIHSLMAAADSEVAQAAIAAVGSHNPYLSDERTDFWLATVGSAVVPGLAKMDPKMKNTGGELYWKELALIAGSNRSAETRALALRALGLVREPALRKPMNRWLRDPEGTVRAAATVLLADFPGAAANRELTELAGDLVPQVRASVARAIGFSQQTELVEVLAKLLADPDASVRRVACASLLSFSPRQAAVAGVFRANFGNREFAPLFLNALARENPDQYLDALARVVEEKTQPRSWGGGQIPAFTAWEILFRYLQTQPPENLSSAKMDRYLDAMEKVGSYSSSEPRDIYAFYLQRGLAARAKKFRQKAAKAASYDLDYYFKQVDQNPSLYKRW